MEPYLLDTFPIFSQQGVSMRFLTLEELEEEKTRLFTCGAILFGDHLGRPLSLLGESRKAMFRAIKKNGVLPDGYTLLGQVGGGAIIPISYEQIDWESVGNVDEDRWTSRMTVKR